MQNWQTIPYVNWQPQVRFDAPALGQILFGHLDVDQAVRAIIATEQGTVPLEPLKCVRLMPWVDQPPAIANPQIARELFDAIRTYEPRVICKKIVPSLLSALQNRWLFKISLHLAGDVEKKIITMDVPYAPA